MEINGVDDVIDEELTGYICFQYCINALKQRISCKEYLNIHFVPHSEHAPVQLMK
jgi:hypothetical protein